MRKRVKRLEVGVKPRGSGTLPRDVERFLEKLSGEGGPYTEEDAKDDMETLSMVATYRDDKGWQSPSGQAKLSAWEQDAIDRLARYHAERGER